MSDFERFLTARNDVLEEAVYVLLWHMAHPDEEPSDANIDDRFCYQDRIGPVLNAAEELLENARINTCRPYYVDDEVPCYLSGTCFFAPCPMCESE